MIGRFTAGDAEDGDCEDGNVDSESLVFSCASEPRREACDFLACFSSASSAVKKDLAFLCASVVQQLTLEVVWQ
jgi:hypothetical protein